MPIKKNNNPFAGKAKTGTGKKKGSGKRVGKSKPGKANNQLNRRINNESHHSKIKKTDGSLHPSVQLIISLSGL